MADPVKPVQTRYYAPPTWLFGAAAAGIAFLFYLATTASIAFPGRSLEILIEYGKIRGTQPLFYPLYEAVVALFKAMPGSLPLKLGLFSAACAWGALTLLFTILSRVVYRTIEEEMDMRARWLAALGAGLAAVAFLAFCKPFWYAANRADYACFHLLLLLGVFRLFLMWTENMNRPGLLFLVAFLYGLGMAEFATFIVFAPLVGMTVLVLLAMSGRLSSWRVVLLVLCGLAGMSLYGWTAWRYAAAPHVLNPASGPLEAFVFVVKGQLNLVMRSLPYTGWLLVGLTTFIPWIILLPLHRRGLRSETGWSFISLHVVFVALTVALLFDFTLSPWRLLGERNMLVTPYLCAAMVFGYLVAFWIVEENNPWAKNRSGRLETFRKRLCRGMVIGMGVLVVVPAGLYFQANNVRQAGVYDMLSRQILESMGDREWLVTDGVLDSYLTLTANGMGKKLNLMDMSRGDDRRQMREIAAKFRSPRLDEKAHARLRNQAELGLVPFLQEWMRMDPGVDRDLALMIVPDLWYGAERTPIPFGLVFLGVPEGAPLDLDKLRTQNRAIWARMQEMAPKEGTPVSLYMWHYFNRQMSLMANNLGVLLEDNAQPNEAYSMYDLSRSMESNNLSALLNQFAMIKGGYPAPNAEAVSNRLAQIEAEALQDFHIWGLSRYYGYVRAPEAFATMGWSWALSGYPGLAVTGLKRALAMSTDDKVIDRVDMALASLYSAQGLPEESRKIYTRMLERDSKDARALLGLAELALRWRRPEEARSYITRAEEANASRGAVAQAWALYHMAIGDNARARVFLEELVATYNSGMTTPWHMLANVLAAQKDERGLEELARKIKQLTTQDFHTSRALAVTAAIKGDGMAMREYLEQALRYRARDVGTLDLLLRMDMKEGRHDMAEQHALEVLRARPDHPYANFVMGTLQMKRREYKLAEDSLTRSLTEQRDPDTLNDLAWAKLMTDQVGEAEKLANEALAKNSQLAAARDTLGMVYLKQGKLDEARKELLKALALIPNLPEFQVHLAEVELAAKNYPAADDLLQKAAPFADRMWLEEREKLQRLTRELREAQK